MIEPAVLISFWHSLIEELADVIADVIIVVVSGIGVDVLAELNVNRVTASMNDLDFALSTPFEKLMISCRAAACFSWWLMIIFECVPALQAWIPSYQVWPAFEFPSPPQFLNQEPPRPQQLLFPDFAMVPHLGHTELMIVVVRASDFYGRIG